MHAGNRSIFQILACVTVFVHVFHCIFAGIKAGLDSWRKMPYVYAEYTVIKVFLCGSVWVSSDGAVGFPFLALGGSLSIDVE